MADVVCLGEVLIDFVPTITPTALTDAPAYKEEAKVRSICRTANAVGALAATERGAIPAPPTPGPVNRSRA
jgi:sugar/nucleoside kinase (ribokinase family)